MAEGEKQSAILKADAAKQARIMAAEAEATSIMKVQQALADAMRMLNENAPNDQVIKLKSLEALQKMADGKATKIIIPARSRGWRAWRPAPRRCWRAILPRSKNLSGKFYRLLQLQLIERLHPCYTAFSQ